MSMLNNYRYMILTLQWTVCEWLGGSVVSNSRSSNFMDFWSVYYWGATHYNQPGSMRQQCCKHPNKTNKWEQSPHAGQTVHWVVRPRCFQCTRIWLITDEPLQRNWQQQQRLRKHGSLPFHWCAGIAKTVFLLRLKLKIQIDPIGCRAKNKYLERLLNC